MGCTPACGRGNRGSARKSHSLGTRQKQGAGSLGLSRIPELAIHPLCDGAKQSRGEKHKPWPLTAWVGMEGPAPPGGGGLWLLEAFGSCPMSYDESLFLQGPSVTGCVALDPGQANVCKRPDSKHFRNRSHKISPRYSTLLLYRGHRQHVNEWEWLRAHKTL